MAGQAGVVLGPGCEQWQMCKTDFGQFFSRKLGHSSTSICAKPVSMSAQTLLYILNHSCIKAICGQFRNEAESSSGARKQVSALGPVTVTSFSLDS